MNDHCIFLSHATSDKRIAKQIKTALELEVGQKCFLFSDDARKGENWFDTIKEAVRSCSEIYSLLTPDSVSRQWLAAEWAAFALQDRPWMPLLLNVSITDVWDAMKPNQATVLTSVDDVQKMLEQIAERTGRNPDDGSRPAAHRLVKDIQKAFEQARLDNVMGSVTYVIRCSRSGNPNIRVEHVEPIVKAGKLADVIPAFLEVEAVDVKRKQFAIALAALDRFSDAYRVASVIGTKAEKKNVALAVATKTPVKAPEDSEEWQFLIKIHDQLAYPQKRDVWNLMKELGIVRRGPWENEPQLGVDPIIQTSSSDATSANLSKPD